MSEYKAACLFCDDIREEKSGKLTILGFYTDYLIVKELPTPMPSLSVLVTVIVPISNIEFEGELIVDFNGDEKSVPLRFTGSLPDKGSTDHAGAKMIVAVTASPFVVKKAGAVTVDIDEGSGPRRIAVLPIKFRPDAFAEQTAGL